MTDPTGQVQMASSESLSLPLLSERIAHEREVRDISARYERELRTKSDEHERETRELVARLDDRARGQEAARIEERLIVLNNERARQEADRATYATRTEVDLTVGALGERSALALKELAGAVTTLQQQRERDLGRASGSGSVTGWLFPNLGTVVAIVLALVTLYLLLSER